MIKFLVCASLLVVTLQQTFAQSSKLSQPGQPILTKLDGYERAHCISVHEGIRICKGLSDSLDTFVLEKDGTRVLTWPGIASLGETADFLVLEGDLDNDRHRELIVANHDSVSNGMGVSTWTISVISMNAGKDFAPPLTFSVEEYGSSGTFVSVGGRTNILATRWQWSKDPKRKRGTGLYLLGQWWHYTEGQLVPAQNQRILARRFLQSFADERDNTQESPAIPYSWLSSKRAETLAVDPLLREKRESVMEGVITNVSAQKNTDRWVITIEFKPDHASTVSFTYPQEFSDKDNGITHIGSLKENRIYPLRYIPTSPDRWLKGRRATVITYSDGEQKLLLLKSN